MKQAKRLTREQKEIVAGHALRPKDWMFEREEELVIVVSKKSNQSIQRRLDKFKKLKRR